MMNSRVCVYCGLKPASGSEHVFPKGLGGGPIYLNCVCKDCNNFFSSLEIELIQRSFVGFMRTAQGVQGYSKTTRRAPLRFAHVFYHDKDKHIVYEVGIETGIRPYFRPQIIRVGNSFIPVASDKKEARKFQDKFQHWIKQNNKVVISFPERRSDSYRIAKLKSKKGKPNWEKYETKKIRDALIYRAFHASDNMNADFQPRIFMDDKEQLFVRGQNTEQSLKFLLQLKDHIMQGKSIVSTDSGSKRIEVTTTFSFHVEKSNRALVKIALNCLLYAFPEVALDPALCLPKRYVLEDGPFTGQIERRNDLLDCAPGFHQVVFLQEKRGVVVRITLFEFCCYQFSIPRLKLPTESTMVAVLVNYNSGEIKIMNDAEFISWKCKVLQTRNASSKS